MKRRESGGVETRLRELIFQDFQRYLNQSPDHRAAGGNVKRRVSAALSAPMQCALLYRLSHWCWMRAMRRTANLLATLNALVFKTYISPASKIGPGVFFPHPPGTSFCGRAGGGLTMYSIATCCPIRGWRADDGPALGEGVTVGARAVVQGPIQIGNGTRIGFAVAVERNAPAGVLVVSTAMKAAVRMKAAIRSVGAGA